MKPCRGPLSPANYVETAKTIKHLVVFIPHFNFSQYCDRGRYCAFPRVVAVKESKGEVRGEQIDEFITLFPFIPSPLFLGSLPLGLCFGITILIAHGLNPPSPPPLKIKYHPNRQTFYMSP